MNWTTRGILILLVSAASVAAEAAPAAITVDCNQGQSLNSTLAKLNKQTPASVTVNMTFFTVRKSIVRSA